MYAGQKNDMLISKSLIEINNLSPENQFLLILTIRNTFIGISNNISLIRMKKRSHNFWTNFGNFGHSAQ